MSQEHTVEKIAQELHNYVAWLFHNPNAEPLERRAEKNRRAQTILEALHHSHAEEVEQAILEFSKNILDMENAEEGLGLKTLIKNAEAFTPNTQQLILRDMEKGICPRCGSQMKLMFVSQLSNSFPKKWKCGCGLYATETTTECCNKCKVYLYALKLGERVDSCKNMKCPCHTPKTGIETNIEDAVREIRNIQMMPDVVAERIEQLFNEIADQSKREQLQQTMHTLQVIYTNPNTKDFAQALKNAGLLT